MKMNVYAISAASHALQENANAFFQNANEFLEKSVRVSGCGGTF
jgi:hypothetical protein